MESVKVKVTLSKRKSGFLWSYKPIFVVIQLMMGVNLNVSAVNFGSSSKERRSHRFSPLISWSFGFAMLVFTISVSYLYVIFVLKYVTWESVRVDGYNLTQTNLMMIYISTISTSLETFAVYLIFFVSVLSGKWESLWVILEKIERQTPKLDHTFYRRCRKFAIIGAIIILTFFGLNFKLAIQSIWPGKFLSSFMGCLTKIMEYTVVSVLTLYCVIVFCVAHMFRHLNVKMFQIADKSTDASAYPWIGVYLENWRRHYVLVCQLVDEINSFFGVTLLITMTHSFTNLICDTFEFFFSFHSKELSSLLVHFGQIFIHLFRFSIISFGSHFLESEASKTLIYARQFDLFSLPLNIRMQLDRINVAVSQNSPKITAGNFFTINLSLFPILIGSTLTYLIIVLQQGALEANT